MPRAVDVEGSDLSFFELLEEWARSDGTSAILEGKTFEILVHVEKHVVSGALQKALAIRLLRKRAWEKEDRPQAWFCESNTPPVRAHMGCRAYPSVKMELSLFL